MEYENPSNIAKLAGLIKDKTIRAYSAAMKNTNGYSSMSNEAERLLFGFAMLVPFFQSKILGATTTERAIEEGKRARHTEISLVKMTSKINDLSVLPLLKANTHLEQLWAQDYFQPQIAFASVAHFLLEHMNRSQQDEAYRESWIQAVEVYFAQREEVAAQVQVTQTEWVILPVGGDGIPKAEHEGDGATAEKFIDKKRIENLFRIVKIWGSGRVVRGRLKGSGRGHSYYAAILPQIVDGTLVEHAIADCEEGSDNAIYAFRGDRPGEKHTWEFVFDGNKPRAKGFGAKVIKHTDHVEENTIEYLTRPLKQLNDTRYRR